MNTFLRISCFCYLVCFATAIKAQQFTEFNLHPASSSPNNLFVMAPDKMIFMAKDTVNFKHALWVTDGTLAGTKIIKRIDITTASTTTRTASNFTKYYGKALFLGNDGINGAEPWLTDGTATGTKIITDINPGAANSVEDSFVDIAVYSGKIYFLATDGIHNIEPWMSDGTVGGTQMLKDIHPSQGCIGGWNSLGGGDALVVGSSRMFFPADDGVHGIEPWISDGSPGGTMMLKDINTTGGTFLSGPYRYFRENNGKTFFVANDGIHGREIWVTDGTIAGTQILADIYPGSSSSVPEWIGVFNGKLFFSAQDSVQRRGVWFTDGTASGTQSLNSMCSLIGGDASRDNSIIYNNKLFFSINNCTNGRELWVTDGTTTGTQFLMGFIVNGAYDGPIYYFEFNGKIYFRANDGMHGSELWVTDGTTSGTKMVKDILQGLTGSNPDNFIVYHNKFYFRANVATSDKQMFESDGTETGTKMIMPTGPFVYNALGSSNFDGFTEFANKLFFTAWFTNSGMEELWSFQDTTILSVNKLNLDTKATMYPNPAYANDIISIEYTVAEAGDVSMKVMNGIGQVVAMPYNSDETAGRHTLKFRAADYSLSAGMYFIQLTTATGSVIQKVNIW